MKYVKQYCMTSNNDYCLSINTKLYISDTVNNNIDFINEIILMIQDTYEGSEGVQFCAYTRRCASAYYIFNTISVLNNVVKIDNEVLKMFIADFAFHFVMLVNPIGTKLSKDEIDKVYKLIDLAEKDKYINNVKKNMLLQSINDIIEYRKDK